MSAVAHPNARAIARRTAVIDLGSNSFRLVVFSVGESGWWKRTDELSETVRLGGDLGPGGELSPPRMAHALETLRVFAAFCATNGIHSDQIEAVATSAVRDAPNGEEFVARARRATGLPIRVLSQRDEAWFSYVAAVNQTTLRDGIVLDIGGGSLELVAVQEREAAECASWPLGAVRMTDRFLAADGPAAPEAIAALRAHTLDQLAQAPWVATAGRDHLVGIGGAVRNLASAAIRAADLPLESVQGFVLEPAALDALIDELAARTPEERERVPGIKRGRAEVILAGAVVLRTVLEATGAPGIEVVEAGLREGLFLAGSLEDEPGVGGPLVPDVRHASVENLARQHGVDLVHAEHIADLAGQLADALPGAGLPSPGEPELLEAAAILHDVGMAVDYDDHHKHSSYLILGSGLPGFTPREVWLIALMARYHRKGTPQLGAAAALCRPGDEELLLRGAALLRIAEQLERNRDQAVHTARLRRADGEEGVVLELDADGDTVVAAWGAKRQGALFARAFGVPLTVEHD